MKKVVVLAVVVILSSLFGGVAQSAIKIVPTDLIIKAPAGIFTEADISQMKAEARDKAGVVKGKILLAISRLEVGVFQFEAWAEVEVIRDFLGKSGRRKGSWSHHRFYSAENSPPTKDGLLDVFRVLLLVINGESGLK